jgi:hypothetical protein
LSGRSQPSNVATSSSVLSIAKRSFSASASTVGERVHRPARATHSD